MAMDRRSRNTKGSQPVAVKKHRINQDITDRQVFVVVEGAEPLGNMSTDEALALAQSQNLDLVEVSKNAEGMPVCRILEYGKMLYQQSKNESRAKKLQTQQQTKEIRLTFGIEAHDMQVRANQVEAFLSKGNKVRVSLFLRGRERGRPEVAKEKMLVFYTMVSAFARMEKDIVFQGNSWAMVLLPLE